MNLFRYDLIHSFIDFIRLFIKIKRLIQILVDKILKFKCIHQNLYFKKQISMNQGKIQKKYKTKKERQPTIKTDFKQFFIESVGQTNVQQGDFEQIQDNFKDLNILSIQKQEPESDDFYVQGDQLSTDTSSIKNMQFWKSMVAPPGSPFVSKQSALFQVECVKSFGFNSLGRDNIILIDSIICKAVGCILIFNQKIYWGHNFKITTLSYCQQTKQLISATEGLRPQLFLWKYDQDFQNLQFIKKFSIGGKCESIYALSFWKQKYVVVVEKFTLHKSSVLSLFSKQKGDRQQIKVGKFYDMETCLWCQNSEQDQNNQNQKPKVDFSKQKLYYANEQGIFQIQLSQQQGKLKISTIRLFQSNKVSCLCPFYDQSSQKVQIIYGDKQGNIIFVPNQDSKQKQRKIKVHNGWIFEIKTIKYKGFRSLFALGAIDLNLSIMKYDNSMVVLVSKLELGGYGRSIFCEGNSLLVGKRDGNFQIYKIDKFFQKSQYKKQARFTSQQSSQTSALKYCEIKPNQKQYILYNQKSNNYIYGNQRTKTIYFFKNQQKFHTSAQSYLLRYLPTNLDVYDKMVAYTYDVLKQDQLLCTKSKQMMNTFGGSTILKKQEKKTFNKSVLLIEDYARKKLLKKIPLNLKTNQSSLYKQKCTAIKISPTGKIIIIGFADGRLCYFNLSKQLDSQNNYSVEQYQSILLMQLSSLHKQKILEIIFSRDNKFFKSISTSEVFYWIIYNNVLEDAKNGEAKSNENNKSQNKSMIQIKSIKNSQSKQINWLEMGKFSWDSKNIWEGEGLVDDIYKIWSLESIKTQVQNKKKNEILKEKNLIVGCSINNGILKLYNWPANRQKCQIIKMNDSKFQVLPIKSVNNSAQEVYYFWLAFSGMLVLIKVSS